MTELTFEALIPLALAAGFLTFFAPCTLPLVPGYLAFIGGVDTTAPEQMRGARKRIFINALFFVIGFSVIFTIFGIAVGLLGSAITPLRDVLTKIAGIFIIVLGVWMTGLLDFVPFLRRFSMEKHIRITNTSKKPSKSRSFLFGLSFGFGWSPCAGPILAAILSLAVVSATAIQGAYLLLLFSLGLAIPFLLTALALGSAQNLLNKLARYLKGFQIVAGLFLAALGVLLLTGDFIKLVNWGFRILPINLEGLLL